MYIMKVLKIQDLLNIEEYKCSNTKKLADLVNQTITIVAFEPRKNNKYNKDGYKLEVLAGENKYTIYTCAAIIVKQLTSLKLKLAELNYLDNIGIECKVKMKYKQLYLDSTLLP